MFSMKKSVFLKVFWSFRAMCAISIMILFSQFTRGAAGPALVPEEKAARPSRAGPELLPHQPDGHGHALVSVQPEPGPERAGAGGPGAQTDGSVAMPRTASGAADADALRGAPVALDGPASVPERGGQGRAAPGPCGTGISFGSKCGSQTENFTYKT